MKDFKTDSSANLSRFARDKRQRISSTERVESHPRYRREADSEGEREFRPRTTTKRSSFNPHFTAENRLRPEYEHQREERTPNRERSFARGERSFDRQRRTESGHSEFRTKRSEGGYRAKSEESRGSSQRGSFNKPYEGGSYKSKPSTTGEKRTAYKPTAKRDYTNKSREEAPRNYPKYNPNKQTGEVRLNRFIAQSGICSRREADDFILAGVVTVNGQVVTELGTKILPTDEVRFNDEKLQGEKHVYLVLNKPKGYVTSLDDPYADKTVMDLVKNACTERVYPVGRLDKNSLGLLLITNDGDITRQLTHPSYHKKKIYQVTLDKPLTRADMDTLSEGITLEDGDIFADEIAYTSEDKKSVGIEIHSGRNRIVRRMFEHLGYAVQKLDRVYYAGLTKKNLKRGAWRFLTRDEVMRLKTGQYE